MNAKSSVVVRRGWGLLGIACGLLTVGGVGAAEGPAEPLLGPVLNVWLENDLIVRTDRHYTHGSRVGYTGRELSLEGDDLRWDGDVARWLPDLGMEPEAWRIGISVTQNIYTPRDISIPTVIVDERPYAAWLYTTSALLKRGRTRGGTPVLDTWAVNVGVVGPGALGEEAQNSIHRIRSIELAQGWGNQLKNEPAVGVRYARALRYDAPLAGSVQGQFLPFAGLQLDTVQTYASAGAQWRIGLNAPKDFGWRSIDDVVPASGGRPANGFRRGLYMFFGVEGRAYAHNMLVGGSLYHDSHAVDMQPFLGEFKMGFGYSGKRWELAYTHMVRSKEFKQQDDIDSFGSLSLACKW